MAKKFNKSNKSFNLKSKKDFTVKDDRATSQYSSKTRSSRNSNRVSAPVKSNSIIQAVGNFSWKTPLGMDLSLDRTSSTTSINASRANKIPGYSIYSFIPCFGVSNDPSSMLNTCAHSVYNRVRYANSGHVNYESPDLMIYLLCVSSLYLWYDINARAYGRMRYFTHYNKYVSIDEITSMGFDYSDLSGRMTDWFAYLQILKSKISKLKVPKDFRMFTRQHVLCSGVYKDANDEKHQDIIFNPTNLYTYALDSQTPAMGMAQLIGIPYTTGTPMNFATIQSYSDALLGAVFVDEDFNIMSGDIMKAYEESGCFELYDIPQDLYLEADYDEDILWKIRNSAVFQGIIKAGTFNVTQTATPGYDPYLIVNPTVDANSQGYELRTILTASNDDPTAQETYECSRFTVACKVPTASGVATYPYEYEFLQVGTELIIECRVYYYDTTGTLTSITVPSYWEMSSLNATSHRTTLLMVGMISTFTWHHRLFYVYNNGSTSELLSVGIGALENYAVLDPTEIKKIHDAALMYELNLLS